MNNHNFTVTRFEYGEMNITKLNQRIDDIEDEIYREKLKIKKCADDLGETFDDMLTNYWWYRYRVLHKYVLFFIINLQQKWKINIFKSLLCIQRQVLQKTNRYEPYY